MPHHIQLHRKNCGEYYNKYRTADANKQTQKALNLLARNPGNPQSSARAHLILQALLTITNVTTCNSPVVQQASTKEKVAEKTQQTCLQQADETSRAKRVQGVVQRGIRDNIVQPKKSPLSEAQRGSAYVMSEQLSSSLPSAAMTADGSRPAFSFLESLSTVGESIVQPFSTMNDPLRFPTADAATSVHCVAYTREENERLCQQNRDVLRLLRRHHHPAAGQDTRSIVMAAAKFISGKPKSTAILAQHLLKQVGYYGGHSGENISSEMQRDIINDWMARNILSGSTSNHLLQKIISDPFPEYFSVSSLRTLLTQEIYSLGFSRSDRRQKKINDEIWDNIIQRELPILSLPPRNDKHKNTMDNLELQSFEWVDVNAGLLYLQRLGVDGKTFSIPELADFGQSIYIQLKAGIAPPELVALFKLPALIHYVVQHSVQTLPDNKSEWHMLEKTALEAWFQAKDDWLRNAPERVFNQIANTFREELEDYKTRPELAKVLLADKKSDFPVEAYLNGETIVTGVPEFDLSSQQLAPPSLGVPPIKAPVIHRLPPGLPPIDRVFNRQNKKIANSFALLDTLLVGNCLERLDHDELTFIREAEVGRMNVLFSAVDTIKHTQLGKNVHARSRLTISLRPDVEVFYAMREGEERIYVLSTIDGEYRLSRTDRNPEHYYDFALDNKPWEDSDFKLIANPSSDGCLKQTAQPLETLIEPIVNRHQEHFRQGLHREGYKKTSQQKTLEFMLSLVPFHDCIKSSIEKRVGDAVLACSIDTLSFIPVAGQAAGLSARFGRVLTTGTVKALQKAVMTKAAGVSLQAAIRQGGKAFTRYALLPASEVVGSKELMRLGTSTLSALDPGIMFAGRVGKSAVQQMVRAVQAIGDRLPGLKNILPSLRQAADRLPNAVPVQQVGRLSDSKEAVPIVGLDGNRHRGNKVFARINPENGEIYGKKYTLDSSNQLVNIPHRDAIKLKNTPDPKLAARTVKEAYLPDLDIKTPVTVVSIKNGREVYARINDRTGKLFSPLYYLNENKELTLFGRGDNIRKTGAPSLFCNYTPARIKRAPCIIHTTLNSKHLMEQTGFKEGKLYRADRTHPEKIENNDGFYISEDFSAVNKMIDADALIVSESLEGIYNYIMLSGNMKGYYIYEIIADDVRGVSLNTNMEHNKDGLRHFITAGCPEYWTDVEPDDWFELTQGANKLEEVHVYHSDVNREKIKYLGPAGDVFRDKATS